MIRSKPPGFVSRLAVGTLRRTLRVVLHAFTGGLLVLAVVTAVVLDRRPDLEIWHEADLDEEFTVATQAASFRDYTALEDRLFAQLETLVYDQVPGSNDNALNRFQRGSSSDPRRFPGNWNRSFEFSPDTPHAGAVLVHGLSDSPYSLRSIAQSLRAEGFYVLGLRVPGHGTAPVGLVHAKWEDMAAATALAVRHASQRLGGAPLFFVGYSNGAALGVEYALSALENPTLPAVDGLVLISPEIGITKLARFAVWQERLGHLLGLRQLSWNSVQPEYDPFKYGSFALNAGKQSWELTAAIQKRITRLTATGALDRFPPLIAFQSVVDATVSAPALVEDLFRRLPPGRHQLVLFDVNRSAAIESILRDDPSAWIDDVVRQHSADFAITLVTNTSLDDDTVVARHHLPGRQDVPTDSLGLRWPADVYSLAHTALPFPPDDPVYGGPDAAPSPGIQLGNIALRGERGALLIAPADLLRLRWNPFHSYLELRMLAFMNDTAAAPAEPPGSVRP